MALINDTNQGVWFLVLVFVTTVLLIESLYLFWKGRYGSESRKMHRRLHALSAQHTAENIRVLRLRQTSALPILERLLSKSGWVQGIERWVLQSGAQTTVSQLLLWCMLLASAVWAIAVMMLHQSPMIGAILALAGGFLPIFFLQMKRQKRLKKMEQQLPDALDLITRALRAGSSFSAGLQMAGTEMPQPIADEFSAVHDEVNFGVPLQQALTNLTDRVPLTDLRYFTVSVLIQREAGGNLTEVLGNLSRLIRERLKLNGKIRVLSSEGRMSAWVLVVLPFALGGLMSYFNPAFMNPLWTDPMGVTILKTMLILMAIGLIVMRKIVRIRV